MKNFRFGNTGSTVSRIISIFMCATLMLSSVLMVSCGESMEDEQARQILADLVPRSQALNEIFWGEGLPLADESNEALSSVTGAQYRQVAEDCGYSSIAEIKAEAEKIFSADYLSQVYATAFGEYEVQQGEPEETLADGTDDLNLNALYARYIEERGILYENIVYNSYELTTEIYPKTAVVTDSGIGIVVCRVECSVGGQKSEMNITLREQDGVWLLDSPTY